MSGGPARIKRLQQHLQAACVSAVKYDWAGWQTTLPRLPVPELGDTCRNYLEFVRPLLDDAEYATTQAVVADFLAHDGARLQEKLLVHDQADLSTTYVKPFWDDMYLGGRYCLPINSNPFICLEPDPLRKTQVARAANLIHHMLKWQQSVSDGTCAPDMYGKQPGCMREYQRLFATTRIPLPLKDELRNYPDARHIVLFRGAHAYAMHVRNADWEILSEGCLAEVLGLFLGGSQPQTELGSGSDSGSDSALPLRLLTTMEREQWAAARADLEADATNAASLHAIDSAMFHVCLDDEPVVTAAELRGDTGVQQGGGVMQTEKMEHSTQGGDQLFQSMLYGRGRGGQGTCWYDKSVTLRVMPNGDAGFNFEHSWGDGSTILRMINDVWHDAQQLAQRPGTPFVSVAARVMMAPAAEVRELRWVLAAGVQAQLQVAEQAFGRLRAVTDVCSWFFTDFGASEIKSWGYGPDSILQLAFQAAYFLVHKSCAISIYESASTKTFLAGRTEAIRSTSVQGCDAINAMFGDQSEGPQGESSEQRAARLKVLLKEATDVHRNRSIAASRGLGVDRHLFSLLGLARSAGEEVPALFTGADAGWGSLNTSVISTSNCTMFGPSISGVGFGAVCPQGYGLGYIAKANTLSVAISNYTGDAGSEAEGGFGGVNTAKAPVYDTSCRAFGNALSHVFRELKALHG
jgi:hypothetical protein